MGSLLPSEWEVIARCSMLTPIQLGKRIRQVHGRSSLARDLHRTDRELQLGTIRLKTAETR